MKQILLLMVLALGMYSINVSAQTKKRRPVKKNTTTRQATASTTKERQVGNDGYIWYKIKRGNLYGAQDIEGKEIIPIKYNEVVYYCSEIQGTHWFWVELGDFVGAYTRKGNVVVSPDKHFTYIMCERETIDGRLFWNVKNNDGYMGILDARGNEIIPPKYELVYINNFFERRSGYKNPCHIWYFTITKDGKYGACDLNGNILYAPEYELFTFVRDDNGYFMKKRNGDNYISEKINFNENSKFDFHPYDDLFYNFKYSSKISSSSSSSSSNSSNISNSSGNNTTTIVVEHHRDPVPMQEWQQCTSCWGSKNCRNCAGSGTNYIGSSLKRCSMCGGTGKCTTCSGHGGRYITVYR